MTSRYYKSIYNPVEWDAPAHIQAFYTDSRNGDFSLHTPEGITHWQQLSQHFHLPYPNPVIKQTHGRYVVQAPQGYSQEADAIFTTQEKTPCGVLTADCIPILLCHPRGKWVAAVHAGWRGLAKGILYACCQQLPDYQRALAWIGPCICQHHYEVGKSVKHALAQLTVDCGQHFRPQKNILLADAGEKFCVDLSGIAETQLQAIGIRAIFKNRRCTYGDEHLYSFRQDAQTGRIVSIIWIK